MLKWAVGQRNPSSASSTCSEITPSAACCPSTCRHHHSGATFKLNSSSQNRHPRRQSSTHNVKTAYVRNLKTADKENRKKCRKSSENDTVSSGTKRTRDSIYMHLDSIPVALRDVSNHWSPGSCGGDNAVERDTKSTKRKHVRLKKSPCRVSSHKCTSNTVHDFVPAAVTVVAEQPANSNETNEKKKDLTDRLDAPANVTQTALKKPLLEKKKQPCNGKHHPFVASCAATVVPGSQQANPAATSNAAAPSMLFDTPQYFTIQTSPPEEPDELFHKALPLKRSRPAALSDDCDTLTRCNRARLRPSVCDIPEYAAAKPPCEVSTLTRSLSWLQLNAAAPHDATLDVCSPSGPADDLTLCDSSLEITNPNSAVLSDTNLSSVSFATTISSKPTSLKRKCVPAENATYVISDAAAKAPNTVERIIKSKRRCVIFNEQSFTLSTPPLSENSRNSCSSGATSLDLDQPSTLRRQKVIRRKRRQNYARIPQTVYNKNLKSVLTLPHGIPSPFEVNDTQFKILAGTPFSTCTNISDMLCDDEEESAFSVLKKAVSTPKPDCPFDLTEDVFLSPGVRPLLDSVIMQTTCSNTMAAATAAAASDTTTNSLSKVKDDEDTNCFVSPVCEQTWNSHGQLLPKAVSLRDNDVDSSVADSTQSSNSSRINDDQDGFSSIVSSTPTQASTSTIDRPHPRSRRCLSFVSPTTPKSSTVKPNRIETGQLDLRIYYNNGLLTVHIIRARNLHKLVEPPCNAYVKMNLVPQGPSKTFHRTCVRKNSFNPKFDHKFSMEITQSDLNKRVLISTYHRDRGKRKSEFLGCMSFAIKNILKKEINGSYKLVSHSSNKSSYLSQVQQSQEDLMASRITNIIDDRIQQIEAERLYATGAGNHKLRPTTITKKDTIKVYEEYMFLQHLELEPSINTTTSPPTHDKESGTKNPGRTPCTTTHKLVKQQSDSSYGFTIAWTKPPRVERVDANSLADKAGLRPGDFVVFVNNTNVITRSEEQILKIIQNCGNQLVLEIYRKVMANGTISNSIGLQRNSIPSAARQHSMTRRASSKINRCESVANNNVEDSKSTTAYSTTTAASTSEASIKRLQLPQITFSSEDKPEEAKNSRQHFVYQLLKEEQQYALSLQFGISRFLLPLAERRDVIRPSEHQVLFQNVRELLRITEDLLERSVLEEGELFGRSVGKIYLKKFPAINSAYRRYCCGLKKADCILVEKTRCGEFMRLVTDPPIPKKRPDLVAFIHKPLQHYRDILKIIQLITSSKESKELDPHVLSKLVSAMQATYRDITVESGLMDCGAEGRPILSLQDLESRLVFTRCKPFTLNSPGRKWIFAGDLSRVEGKSTRLFWALLFSDILLFTKINRDRVVFVTEEPLPLATVAETQFNVKKRDTEFRLIIGAGGRSAVSRTLTSGTNSPQQGCVALAHFHSSLVRRTPHNKDLRRRTLIFRAPSAELKAVWQNLIQRQVIKINTTEQGITPTSSPTESPIQATSESAITITTTNSTVHKRQCDGPIDDIIQHKCKLMSKCVGKGKAFHMAQWMRGELNENENVQTWIEQEIEIWSPEMLQQRTELLDINLNHGDAASTVTEFDVMSCTSQQVNSTQKDNSQTSPKSEGKLCQKCHETCLQGNNAQSNNSYNASKLSDDNDAFLNNKTQETSSTVPKQLSPVEPFNPVPGITITTPNTLYSEICTNDTKTQNSSDTPGNDETNNNYLKGEDDDEGDSNSDNYLPYQTLESKTPTTLLKRYSSFKNLHALIDDDNDTDTELPLETNDKPMTMTTAHQGMFSWANRASTFVAQKVALFEKIGENVQNSSFLDSFRYLKPSADFELTSTSQTLAFEEDCENSGGTSGDEFWGTPNSGGASVASNEGAALSPNEDDDNEQQIIEEMLLNRMTVMLAQQHNMTPNRMLQNKSRLETLPEAEEENITRSSSSSISSELTSLTVSDCTMSCPATIQSEGCNVAGNYRYTSHIGQSSNIFAKIKLRRSQSIDNSNTEIDDTEKNSLHQKSTERTKKSRLSKLFSGELSNSDENRERRFWRKRRRKQTT